MRRCGDASELVLFVFLSLANTTKIWSPDLIMELPKSSFHSAYLVVYNNDKAITELYFFIGEIDVYAIRLNNRVHIINVLVFAVIQLCSMTMTGC